MKRFPLDPGFLWRLLFAEGAGVEIAGESGSGKSVALLTMLRSLLLHIHFLVFVDPDHDSAESLYHFCLSDPQLARRTVYFKFNDPDYCGSFDPLAVIPHPNPTVTEARRATKIEHKTNIELAAWGEKDVNSRPTLAKNATRVSHTASRLGLAAADEELFLDTQSEYYPVLCQGVTSPIHRSEMLELRDARPVDRENQLGSFKNRKLTQYANPLMQAIHAKTAQSGAYSFEEGYRLGQIWIGNVHRGTTLREMDQQVICNEVLSEYFSVVMSRPPAERRPSLCCVEELPVFEHSFDLFVKNLPRLRKFMGRIVACHQGIHTFEGGADSRLLNLIRTLCPTHLYFRSSSPSDAKFTAEQIHLPSINLKKVKYKQYDYEQYHRDNKIVTLHDRSEGSSDSEEFGGSDSLAENNSVTNTSSHADHQSADPLHSAIVDAQSQAAAQGTTETRSKNWAKSSGRNRSITIKQTIVPVMAWRRVLRKIEFWTADEQYLEMASRISRQRTGACFLFMNGQGAQQFQFPLLPDPFARSPKYGQRKIDEFQAQLLERPEFDTIENVEAYRRRFLNILIDQLRKLPVDGATGLIVPPRTTPNITEDAPSPNEPKDGPWTI